MAEQRIVTTDSNPLRNIHEFEAIPSAPIATIPGSSSSGLVASKRAHLNSRSESPRVQQILLHQKLKEDIERNSMGRVRYLESELHLRNQNNPRFPNLSNSEIQIGTIPNIGRFSNNKQQSSKQLNNSTLTAATNNKQPARGLYDLKNELTDSRNTVINSNNNENNNNNNNNDNNKTQTITTMSDSSTGIGAKMSKNCQVCLIREVRQELMNVNKIVQQRNEQITKLKAKCLRSYFERQMS